ncbi:hypothetical protein JK628_23190 (plasmid) [Shewanella sp. KX20019]|uniref:hypothetical protein n=1 Tax=Shewanella sp. KX20019 TaxID=2803864 RepID=UPI001927965C|nr:hypothetical protein [Shewanella sp. KX20019]QQX82689.1 hypothetical protein JK628_23190 [Shewanella sp. KX20019]
MKTINRIKPLNPNNFFAFEFHGKKFDKPIIGYCRCIQSVVSKVKESDCDDVIIYEFNKNGEHRKYAKHLTSNIETDVKPVRKLSMITSDFLSVDFIEKYEQSLTTINGTYYQDEYTRKERLRFWSKANDQLCLRFGFIDNNELILIAGNLPSLDLEVLHEFVRLLFSNGSWILSERYGGISVFCSCCYHHNDNNLKLGFYLPEEEMLRAYVLGILQEATGLELT